MFKKTNASGRVSVGKLREVERISAIKASVGNILVPYRVTEIILKSMNRD